MTGMGGDGADAMTRLRQQGGRTIAEAESTAVVWGMPGELVKNGGAEFVRPVEDIAGTVVEMVDARCPSLSADPPLHRPQDHPRRMALPRTSPPCAAQTPSPLGAARALGGRAEAVPALAAALGAEQIPRVREAIMTALMRVGDEASVKALLPYLRSQDAGLARRGHRGPAGAAGRESCPSWRRCSETARRDVRILATELVRNMPAADATHLLCSLLEYEQHPNVCAAAIDVLAEVGTRDALPALAACAERFCRNPILCRSRSRPPSPGFQRRKARAEWHVRRLTKRVPSTSPRTTFAACANFSIAAPACCLPTTSATTSTAVSPSELRRRDPPSFQSYFALLRSDAEHEIEHLVNAFTVNETYFNREEHQLRCMTSNLLERCDPQKTARGSDPHLVDSVFDRRRALFDRDLADGELERGRQLQHRDRRLRHRHPRAQGRRRGHLWRPRADAALPGRDRALFQADRWMRSVIRSIPGFEKFHPVHPRQSDRYRRTWCDIRNFDIIFCRNVLIYFDDASRRVAAENLYDCLRPGGYICLGHSETMSRISTLFRRLPVSRTRSSIRSPRRTMTDA